MNYQNIHDSIIRNAKTSNRSKTTGTYELHHIIPTCIGGEDTEENTVLLTPREHFIIHYLLWKLNPETRKLRDPIFMFKHKGAKNNRLYEAARISHIEEMKQNNPSTYLSEKSKISKSEKLKKYSKDRNPEHNKKISESRKGQKLRLGAILNDSTKSQISDSLKKYFENNEISEETRIKISEANTGRKHSKEIKDKMKKAALKRPKYNCSECDKPPFDGGNFSQHMKKVHGWDEEKIENYKNSTLPFYNRYK